MIKALLLVLLGVFQVQQQAELMGNERNIVLIRHAKSSWDQPELADFDRPLNDRGYSDAPKMGKQLAMHGIKFDLIIASPSRRTTQTIEFITQELGYPIEQVRWDSTLFHAQAAHLQSILAELDDSIRTVALVGHNPSMTELANSLQSDSLIENVPTCGIVSIIGSWDSWRNLRSAKGKLEFFIYPKLF